MCYYIRGLVREAYRFFFPKKNLKTFSDLEFDMHNSWAHLKFENGYGVSVITGGYGSKDEPYELAVLKNDKICYSTPITDDVIGYLTAEEVTKYMAKIQYLF